MPAHRTGPRLALIAGIIACSSAFSCTTVASTGDRADVDRLELEAVERRFNATSVLASTCVFRTPPGVTASGGSCRPAATGP